MTGGSMARCPTTTIWSRTEGPPTRKPRRWWPPHLSTAGGVDGERRDHASDGGRLSCSPPTIPSTLLPLQDSSSPPPPPSNPRNARSNRRRNRRFRSHPPALLTGPKERTTSQKIWSKESRRSRRFLQRRDDSAPGRW